MCKVMLDVLFTTGSILSITIIIFLCPNDIATKA